jgi:hypothetical protein
VARDPRSEDRANGRRPARCAHLLCGHIQAHIQATRSEHAAACAITRGQPDGGCCGRVSRLAEFDTRHPKPSRHADRTPAAGTRGAHSGGHGPACRRGGGGGGGGAVSRRACPSPHPPTMRSEVYAASSRETLAFPAKLPENAAVSKRPSALAPRRPQPRRSQDRALSKFGPPPTESSPEPRHPVRRPPPAQARLAPARQASPIATLYTNESGVKKHGEKKWRAAQAEALARREALATGPTRAWSSAGSVAASRCSTAHPLYTIFTNIRGPSLSETTMRWGP